MIFGSLVGPQLIGKSVMIFSNKKQMGKEKNAGQQNEEKVRKDICTRISTDHHSKANCF